MHPLKELDDKPIVSMIGRPGRGMKRRARLSRVHHPVKGSTKYNCLWWSLSNAFCASSASCLVFRMHTRNFSPLSSCRQRAHRLECSSRNRSRSGRLSEPDTVPRLSCSACLLEPGKSGPSIFRASPTACLIDVTDRSGCASPSEHLFYEDLVDGVPCADALQDGLFRIQVAFADPGADYSHPLPRIE